MVEANQSYHPQIVRAHHRHCALGGEEGDQADDPKRRRGEAIAGPSPGHHGDGQRRWWKLTLRSSSRRPGHRALCRMKFVGFRPKRSGNASGRLNETLNI
jgi:hypothetical protein